MQYFFDKHGRASKFSAQHIRQQPSPSSHCVDVTVNGVTVVSMVRGFTMADHHQDLPKQPHALACKIMTESEWSNCPTSDELPSRIWRQYGRVRILWTKVPHYVPMRDHESDRIHCMAYIPSRVILEQAS